MSMRDRLNTALYTAKRSAIREFSKLAAQTPDCVRLTLGEPDFDTPPVIRAAVAPALEAGQTHYIANNGTQELRERIAAFERDAHGLACTAEDVVVTTGATEALFVALFGILNPGDEVIVPHPGFILYEQVLNLCRAEMIPLDTTADGFQIRSGALEALITPRTKAILLNSPNNPTGTVYDRESLAAVHEAVKDRDIFVVCDDVYRHLCYLDEYHSFAEYADTREKTLVVESFSKSYAMTGWRMGWLLADAPVRERLELIHQFMVTSTPAPFQEACAVALGQDTGSMREEYRARRELVVRRLGEMGLAIDPPGGAFYVFPSIARYGMDSTTFCTRLLQEGGVAVTPGICFGADDHFRLSYCCSMAELERGLDRLERFLQALDSEITA